MNNETRGHRGWIYLIILPCSLAKGSSPTFLCLVVTLNVFNFNFFIVKIPLTNEKLFTEALKRNTYDKLFQKRSEYSYANWEILTSSQKTSKWLSLQSEYPCIISWATARNLRDKVPDAHVLPPYFSGNVFLEVPRHRYFSSTPPQDKDKIDQIVFKWVNQCQE